MNFFGHATVASWHSDEPAHALGAMLPDFATMSRARLGEVDHPDVARGIALHHRTDSAFHRALPFRRMLRSGIADLADRGLRRGPAWGAAHVGIELLLDGTLVHNETVGALYVKALRAATDIEIPWRTDDGNHRWEDILERLTGHGVPVEYGNPDVVADWIGRILSRRPRLALAADETVHLAAWLRDVQPEVERTSPQLLDEVRGALQAP